METLKGIIGSVFSFLVILILICFCTGYTMGNYYGVKSSIEDPNEFNYEITPAYIILSFKDHPAILKYRATKDID